MPRVMNVDKNPAYRAAVGWKGSSGRISSTPIPSLRNDSFTIHFQPIIDTTRQRVFAHECLIRLVSGRTYTGGEIVEAAMARGSIHLFDSYARQLGIRKAAEQFIPGIRVFINFMPSSIYDAAFCMASTLKAMSGTSLRPEDIVFEVVESERVQDVRHLQRICEYYRKEGFGFALDDVGTGSIPSRWFAI